MTSGVLLRDITEADLPIFFEQQLDPAANHMAAFTARDPADKDAFMRHWARIMSDDTVIKQTILFDGRVAGNIGSYREGGEREGGEREVGYWIGREYWGKGIATETLSEFLRQVKERPLYARAAKDNAASIRVLEKCGFTLTGYDRGFANVRGEEIEEAVFELK